MDREQAKDYIKNQIEDYLQGKGINTRKNFNCLNPQHIDNNPSMSLDRKRNKAHCFSCGADYDTFDLIGIDYNLTDPAEIFNKGHELYNIYFNDMDKIPYRNSPEAEFNFINDEGQKQDKSEQNTPNTQEVQIKQYIQLCKTRAKDTDYFKTRGLTDKVIEKYNLGYDPNYNRSTGGKVWQAVIIPTGENSFTARNTAQNIDKKDRIRKTGASPIYNLEALYNGNPVYITEGEIDALSIIEAGGEAVGLGSTSNMNGFINICKKKAPANTLILALDNDKDGEETTQKLKQALSELNISFLEADMAGGYKDPNEALINNREAFIEAIQENIRAVEKQEKEEKERGKTQYLKQSTAHHIQEFINGIAQSVDTPYIPTGFNKFDEVLEGGLYEGLYIIGAISSLGKTTFVLQIADQIAQQGQDILIFSLEMARSELMAKSMSRITFDLSKYPGNAKTTRGITTGKRYQNYNPVERELIKASIKAYGEYANHIFINEGMGDIGALEIKETVKKHINITGKSPVVIIDYLQLIAPYEIRATDKQNTDKAVMELKRLSRDYKIPVVGISSFNRQNYNQPVSMEAFKESGAIEYSSDVLLGLQAKGAGTKEFDIDEAKKKDPREIELKILKNRNGATGSIINYDYYPLFNCFKEV